MKRILGIAAIILFFLLLLALLVVKLFFGGASSETPETRPNPFDTIRPPSVTIQNDTPEHTIASCYAWYVDIYSHDEVTIDDIMSRPELADCFTQAFLNTWDERRTSVEADPVLLTQDYLASWRTSPITSVIVGQSVRTQDVEVTIGTRQEQVKVVAHLVRDGQEWKIDSVTPAS